jgi:CubicO group peptidase (beta-lactamase class C family)
MKRFLGLIGMGILLFPLSVGSQSLEQKEAALSPGEKMDKLFDFWNRLDQPGFAVAVVKDGQVVYQKVLGLACQEHRVAITPNSVFNTATLAQTFVGQAVAILEKQGKLSLDEDVRKYIPEIPDFGTPLKLRRLVFQSSGLRDWWPVLQLTGRDKEELTFASVLKLVQAQKKPIFTPGERSQYSNTNYDLLAEVIKRATGKPFSEWAWENIFKPAKMTRTLFRDNFRSILDDQAFSYNFTRAEYLKGIDNLSLTGSHSLYASVADLAKWLAAVEAGPAEHREIVAKMFASGTLDDGRPAPYGYGLGIGARQGRRLVSQAGTWAGSGATLTYFPDQKFGFVVLANWDYTAVDGFIGAIIDIFLPSPAPPPAAKKPTPPPAAPAKKAVKVGPEKLDQYAGSYRLGQGQVVGLSREGGDLVLSVPGQKFVLTPLSENEFQLDVAGATLVFQKNAEGKVHQFLWKQGGTEVVAPRIVLVKPTPEELKEYTGTYVNDEVNLRLVLALKGASLVFDAPGQGEVRLTPDEKDRFLSTWRVIPALVFQRDGQGKVSGFSIDSDPVRDLIFKRE